jgi:sugar O-acyltransferase (sialic acid O-acetyltransferase NeuD family)
MKIVLIGAGGHARNVVDMLTVLGHQLVGYVDARPTDWLSVPHYVCEADVDATDSSVGVSLGMGGVASIELHKRVSLLDRYQDRGRAAPPLAHPEAYISRSVTLGDGCQVMAGAMIQASSKIGRGAIVNTGVIVEHESHVGNGAHVAPGAILLGNVKIGDFAMVGAGAVVLPGATVPDGALIKAGTRFPA